MVAWEEVEATIKRQNAETEAWSREQLGNDTLYWRGMQRGASDKMEQVLAETGGVW